MWLIFPAMLLVNMPVTNSSPLDSVAAWASPSARRDSSLQLNRELRRVVVGEKEDLARTQLEADRLNWLVPDLPPQFTCHAKIRYRHQAAAADVKIIDEDRLQVEFHEPQYGVAPGQAVVLYDADRVLGGGWIM